MQAVPTISHPCSNVGETCYNHVGFSRFVHLLEFAEDVNGECSEDVERKQWRCNKEGQQVPPGQHPLQSERLCGCCTCDSNWVDPRRKGEKKESHHGHEHVVEVVGLEVRLEVVQVFSLQDRIVLEEFATKQLDSCSTPEIDDEEVHGQDIPACPNHPFYDEPYLPVCPNVVESFQHAYQAQQVEEAQDVRADICYAICQSCAGKNHSCEKIETIVDTCPILSPRPIAQFEPHLGKVDEAEENINDLEKVSLFQIVQVNVRLKNNPRYIQAQHTVHEHVKDRSVEAVFITVIRSIMTIIHDFAQESACMVVAKVTIPRRHLEVCLQHICKLLKFLFC
mmetsp:Transcript_70585/g.140058  ORF Transcript_70585/g.140058 Transcript_70585/m.140058 type:complete len:337 (+) Transcript_70585:198-1208(+)